MIVRKSVLEQLGGFDTKFWPGEDTKLCLEITKKLNKKIIYSPDVLVYHHRRPLFTSHLKQVWSYALHRGYFVKRFPETSLRLTYFIPSIFVFGLMFGLIFALFNPIFRSIYLFGLSFYLICVFLSVTLIPFSLKEHSESPLLQKENKNSSIPPSIPPLSRGDTGGLKGGKGGFSVENLKIKFAAFWGVILTHIYYGVGFIMGLVSKRLREEQV
ncbi:MAG: hypothetical protein HY776_00140 [Actinobacteria bacterium]|nr:hypothetical protein [Actinomycetota bacterium]